MVSNPKRDSSPQDGADEAGGEVEGTKKLYMVAAESYLKAIKLLEDADPEKQAHRAMAVSLLSRAEELKSGGKTGRWTTVVRSRTGMQIWLRCMRAYMWMWHIECKYD